MTICHIVEIRTVDEEEWEIVHVYAHDTLGKPAGPMIAKITDQLADYLARADQPGEVERHVIRGSDGIWKTTTFVDYGPHDATFLHTITDTEPPGPWLSAVTTYGASPTVREEWRVTGKPGGDFGPYNFVWGSEQRLGIAEDEDPEGAARGFIAYNALGHDWDEGPFLHHRTVTTTDWEPV